MPRSYGTTNVAPYSSAPAVGSAGDLYYNTTDKQLYGSDGSAWNAGYALENNVLTLDGVMTTISSGTGIFGVGMYSSTVFPILTIRRAKGTSGTPTQLLLADLLAQISFQGYNSGAAAFATGASIRAVAEQAWTTSGSNGTRIEFWNGPNAGGANVTNMVLDNVGTLYVGGGQNTNTTPIMLNPSGLVIATGTTGSAAPRFTTRRNDGVAVAAGTTVGLITFVGATDAVNGLYTTSQIVVVATELYSGTAAGSRLMFYTTPNTTRALAVVGIFDQNGSFGVGSAASAAGNAFNVTSAGVVNTASLTSAGSVTITSGALTVSSGDFFVMAGASLFASGVGAGIPLTARQDTVGSPVMSLTTVTTADDPTETTYQGRGVTTTNVNVTLVTVAVTLNAVVMIEARTVGRRTGGSNGTGAVGNGVSGIYQAVFRNVSGTVTQIGAATTIAQKIDAEFLTGCSFVISGTSVLVQTAGVVNTNVTWHATVRAYGPLQS